MKRMSPKARSKSRDEFATMKMHKVMGEFAAGDLHSGSKSGPMVKSRKQAIAIGISEGKKRRKK